MSRRLPALLFAAGILAAAALPLLGRAWRAGGPPRCALDGVRVDPARAVRVLDGAGGDRSLCCVACARRWIREEPSAAEARILLVDEVSGRTVPAEAAWLVESRIVAFGPSGCRVHVFARREDADRHAEAFGGRPVAWTER